MKNRLHRRVRSHLLRRALQTTHRTTVVIQQETSELTSQPYQNLLVVVRADRSIHLVQAIYQPISLPRG